MGADYQGVLSLRVDDVMERITERELYLISNINNNTSLPALHYSDPPLLGEGIQKHCKQLDFALKIQLDLSLMIIIHSLRNVKKVIETGDPWIRWVSRQIPELFCRQFPSFPSC